MSDYEGQEIKKGEIALEKGTELNPASIGFIAGLGIRKIRVYRRPRVAFFVTGEEVVGIDEELRPGKIRDTNSITLFYGSFSRKCRVFISWACEG
jgi:molybdopterin biosynthesis enzyme